MNFPILTKGVSLEEVQSSKSGTIYYSSRTVWWTDDPNDLQKSSNTPIPLDVFGAPLFQAPKADFLKSALSKPEHYGVNGIETFMASHHKNFNPKGQSSVAFTQFDVLDGWVSVTKKIDEDFTLLTKNKTA